MAIFASEDEYVSDIARRMGGIEEISRCLGADALPEAVLHEFALQLDGLEKKAVEQAAVPSSAPFQGINRRFRWIIADDDLKALDAFADALKAAAPVTFFFGEYGPVTGAITGLLLAGAKLFRQAAKKGARVSPGQLRILLILKRNRPVGLTTNELLTILRRSSPAEEAEVEADLANLEKLAVADGTLRSFVSKDGAGRWHAAGI